MPDRIEKTVEIKAPVERVWRALTDHREFGQWFKVALDQPFAVGAPSTGHMTYPGFEHLPWAAEIVEMSEPTRFVYRWPPYDDDPAAQSTDHSKDESWTTVTFTLEPTQAGTRLTVIESGFDALSERLRDRAYKSNTGGWEEQVQNIRKHVEG